MTSVVYPKVGTWASSVRCALHFNALQDKNDAIFGTLAVYCDSLLGGGVFRWQEKEGLSSLSE